MHITTSIDPEEFERQNKSKKREPARVCIDKKIHKKLKTFAATLDVSMQSVIECFVEKLPE